MKKCNIVELGNGHRHSYINGINYIDGYQYGYYQTGTLGSLSYHNGSFFFNGNPLDLSLLQKDKPKPSSPPIDPSISSIPAVPLIPSVPSVSSVPFVSSTPEQTQIQTNSPTYECWRTIGKRVHPDGRIEYNIKQRIAGVSHTQSEYSYIRSNFNQDGTTDYDVKERIPN